MCVICVCRWEQPAALWLERKPHADKSAALYLCILLLMLMFNMVVTVSCVLHILLLLLSLPQGWRAVHQL
jgi:hypothetical protein